MTRDEAEAIRAEEWRHAHTVRRGWSGQSWCSGCPYNQLGNCTADGPYVCPAVIRRLESDAGK